MADNWKYPPRCRALPHVLCSTCIQDDVVDKEHAGHVVRKRSFKNVRLKLQNFSVDSLNWHATIVQMSDRYCRAINAKGQSSAFNTPSNENRHNLHETTNTTQKNSDCRGASNSIYRAMCQTECDQASVKETKDADCSSQLTLAVVCAAERRPSLVCGH